MVHLRTELRNAEAARVEATENAGAEASDPASGAGTSLGPIMNSTDGRVGEIPVPVVCERGS